jgi:two-component system CheB/CheR fusion protein
MLMQAEIILRAPEASSAPRLAHAARVIHEMVQAQAQLVEDMLDVSRARTGRLTIDRQLLPLSFVIADSIGALRKEAEAKKSTLDLEVGNAPLIVQADPVRVRQVCWNLLTTRSSSRRPAAPCACTWRRKAARRGSTWKTAARA